MASSKELDELPIDCKKDQYWRDVHKKWFVVDETDHTQLRTPGLLKKEYEFRNGSMISLSPKVSFSRSFVLIYFLVLYNS